MNFYIWLRVVITMTKLIIKIIRRSPAVFFCCYRWFGSFFLNLFCTTSLFDFWIIVLRCLSVYSGHFFIFLTSKCRRKGSFLKNSSAFLVYLCVGMIICFGNHQSVYYCNIVESLLIFQSLLIFFSGWSG